MSKEVIEYLSELTERECETVPEMAMDRITYAIQEIERLEAVLQRIENWCKAYPHTVFIEPTKEQWRTADETLDAHKGDNCPSLTAISGSNMRHVVEGIQKIITEALDKEQT